MLTSKNVPEIKIGNNSYITVQNTNKSSISEATQKI